MHLLFSLYLDLIRFVAALAVFFDHLSSQPFTKDVVMRGLGDYGAIAVTIFFLLSGYVISYVVTTRERSAAQYFSSRIARLYSVVLIALLLTFIFDFIGSSANPAFYGIQKILWKPISFEGYASSLLFLNEYQIFRFNGISPGTNGPYWSLSFEATYYLIGGLALFSRKIIWIPVSLMLLALAGKTITVLLPIWFLGFLLYRWHEKFKMPIQFAWPIFLLSGLAIILIPYASKYFPQNNFGLWLPYGRGPFNRDIFQDYIAASIFSLHLVSARNIFSRSIAKGYPMQGLVRRLGALTFPLYCIHYPALSLFAAISPWKNSTFANLLFESLLTILVVIVVSPLCESLKEMIRAGFLRLTMRSVAGANDPT